jgi:hypothetical protein
MKTFFHPEKLTYDGTQLHSHFAYRNFGVAGDAIVAFIGPCEVKTDDLVDVEDARAGLFIRSEEMVHFIVEHFAGDLELAIARQRLLTALIIDEIEESFADHRGATEHARLSRRGNDIYEEGLKLSVSIATRTPVSCLIHTGVNVSSRGTPVPTRGLADYDLNPRAVATGTMNRYVAEIESMRHARAKVRGVM